MEIEEIIQQLKYPGRKFPHAALEAAIAQQDEIIPELLGTLKDTIANADKIVNDDEYMGHLFALYLLAQFREVRAYPLVVELGRLPYEILDIILGDVITEDLPSMLASVCGGDTALIEGLIEDAAVNEYVRSSAIMALLVLCSEGVIDRDDLMGYFTLLFREKLEREHSCVWNELVYASTSLYPEEVIEDIKEAYEEELVDPFYIHYESVEQAMKKGRQHASNRFKTMGYCYVDDTINAMKNWPCFQPVKPVIELPQEYYIPPRRASDKIGPNEPCPCGSGKKYKKCCGSVV